MIEILPRILFFLISSMTMSVRWSLIPRHIFCSMQMFGVSSSCENASPEITLRRIDFLGGSGGGRVFADCQWNTHPLALTNWDQTPAPPASTMSTR